MHQNPSYNEKTTVLSYAGSLAVLVNQSEHIASVLSKKTSLALRVVYMEVEVMQAEQVAYLCAVSGPGHNLHQKPDQIVPHLRRSKSSYVLRPLISR
jgi:hypothetical protein